MESLERDLVIVYFKHQGTVFLKPPGNSKKEYLSLLLGKEWCILATKFHNYSALVCSS